MINSKYYDNRCINTTKLIMDREHGPIDSYVQRRLHASSSYIDRLELEAVLNGHDGCVNCLEWSSDGRMLASGSDDFRVILWDVFRKKRIHSMRTRHLGNMFSVKFMPRHNDSLIATGAADKFIYVFDVNRYNEIILSCHCHAARVKRLATAPDSPFVFWSAGEDGAILQLDIREGHHCRSEENRSRLINLATFWDTNAEAKCLAVNPMRTEYLAVGANDPYARIYDRRMLRPTSTCSTGTTGILGGAAGADARSVPLDSVTYYCPGHIHKNNSRLIEHESRAITYLTFNEIGTELLVNMGGEHVYLYDLQHAEQPVFLSLPEYKPPPPSASASDVSMHTSTMTTPTTPSTPTATTIMYGDASEEGGDTSGGGEGSTPSSTSASTPSNRRKLPEHIEAYKKLGNDFLENEKYLRAIDQYSEAIALAPECSVLYLNRATAYMRRLWFGDVYAALRDCHEALRLDPSYIKAHFRLARALLELGRNQEAEECLKELINRFPSYANNHGVMMLHKDIKDNREDAMRVQETNEAYNHMELSDDEYLWRSKSRDYKTRFVGHCNTTTDIKEANYFGRDGNFIVAGSDDGNLFIWERKTGKIRSVYKADGAIVNCVQPHPSVCLMATSGIDHSVKIWSPTAAAPEERSCYLISCYDKCVEDNQQKMKTDPFDLNTRNAFCWNG